MFKSDVKIDEQELLKECEFIVGLISYKNKLYGDSFFLLREFCGRRYFTSRLFEKIMRYENLEYKDIEKSIDTLNDIIGYCLLELTYINKKEDKPHGKI